MLPELAESDQGYLPKALSVSRLTCYLGCPRKYRFRYIERLDSERVSIHLVFGGAVHSAIAWWWQERALLEERLEHDPSRDCLDGPSEVRKLPDAERLQRIFRADLYAGVSDAEPNLDLDGKNLNEVRKLGERLVVLFAEHFAGEELPERVESHFEVMLRDPRTGRDLPVPLMGFIDFQGGGVLSEIKTCSRKQGAAQWSIQLAAYRYAMREVTGRSPRVRVVELVKTKEPQLHLVDAPVTDRDEAWFMEVAAEVLEGIAAGAFFPNPSWMCRRCEYRGACRGG